MELLKEFMRIRGDIYNVLSVPFHKELSVEYTEVLKKYLPVIRELSVASGDMQFRDAVDSFAEILNIEFDKDRYDGEFAKLFLGVNKASYTGHTVTPHESVFLSHTRLVMQEQWDEVVEIYYNNGLGKEKKFKEPEDHISAEMSFMAHMSAKTAECVNSDDSSGLAKCLETQVIFLKEHLCSWIHLLADDIRRSTEIDFYRCFSTLVECFIESDHNTLEQLKEESITV
ncbi:MAG: molecular chaperone [Deferribacterales bacterium]